MVHQVMMEQSKLCDVHKSEWSFNDTSVAPVLTFLITLMTFLLSFFS